MHKPVQCICFHTVHTTSSECSHDLAPSCHPCYRPLAVGTRYGSSEEGKPWYYAIDQIAIKGVSQGAGITILYLCDLRVLRENPGAMPWQLTAKPF